MIVKALDATLAAADSDESIQRRRADALAQVAEGYLHPAVQSSTADGHQVVVHVDADSLIERCAGQCHIEDGPSLPIETARRLDAHHVEHWSDGGETKLPNLVSLCRTHHRCVHEGGIRIERRTDGGWRGERLDLGLAVAILCDAQGAHDVSAETSIPVH